ncbi:MAG TPA: ShlB/FhaC/HecB family hemolysin secretion/activation protein [Burkholderiaceae bacterium]|jgi:hemolysin activation/secretion protein
MKRSVYKKAPAVALSSLFAAFAQAAEPPQLPNAGSILQQTQPTKPPSASPVGTGLTIEQANGSASPPTAPFPVKEIRISGNTQFDSATLHALVADAEGKSLTLAQLGEAAERITAYYHDHGFPLARAVIPAQTIRNGIVSLTVVEARYGKINLTNRSRSDDGLLLDSLSPLQAGQQIEQNALDHSLLLLSDVPGVGTSATLKPGEAVGTSDLEIEATTPQTVIGNISADDYGNRYTGRDRLGGGINFFDPLHHGDVLSLNVLTAGSDMNYGRIGYEVLLSGLGTRLGTSYSALNYTLGDNLAALGGHGTANVSNVWLKRPFLRSRSVNLYGQVEYDHKQLKDDVDSTSIHTDRHLDELTASLIGDWRDTSGVNSWNLGLTDGRVNFDNAAAQLADASTAKTQGSFTKWTANINRVQSIDQSNALYFAFSGQWSNTNLDASEKMVAGGAYTVRAYDMGVLSGDSGVLGNVEWRHELGQLASGQAQAIAFIDSEHVTINQTTWTSGTNGATLSGAGVGFNWFGPSQWSIKATVAAPLGATPELTGAKKSARGWIEIDKAM